MVKHKLELILTTFEQMFPDAKCELEHQNEFELLVAVMLSAQTTDLSVNKLTKDLFKKYHTPYDYVSVSISELENDIRRIGLYKNKAKSLQGMSQKLIDEFNGTVPKTIKELVSLPGVGKKTANVVVSVAFNQPAFAVDTHVERISKRLAFAKWNDSVVVVERKLEKAIPKELWIKSHHQFIFFGRYFCKAQNPNCKECPLIKICREPNKNN